MKDTGYACTGAVGSADSIASSSITLVVGNLDRWHLEGRMTFDLEEFTFADLSSLSEQTLHRFCPEIILSPLFGDDFDAVDVAKILQRLGFLGRYRVISALLPDANVIRREIHELAPDLDFDLLMVPDWTKKMHTKRDEDLPETEPHSLDNAWPIAANY